VGVKTVVASIKEWTRECVRSEKRVTTRPLTRAVWTLDSGSATVARDDQGQNLKRPGNKDDDERKNRRDKGRHSKRIQHDALLNE